MLFPGQSISIAMSYSGVPPPMISWFKNGSLLVNSSGGINIETTENTSVLNVPDSRGQSGGEYAVNASNSASTATAQFTIECK